KAAGVGHINTQPDIDGAVRREPLAIAYGDKTYPSFSLKVVQHYLGLGNEDVVYKTGDGISIGNSQAPLDGAGNFAITFAREKAFPYYSFYKVIQGNVTPDAFRDKIVLVGPTAIGVGNSYVTPVAHNLPGIEIVANTIDNILSKRFLTRPSWSGPAELVLILLMGLFVSFVLPKLKATPGAIVSAVMLAALSAAGIYFFTAQGWWLKMSYPCLLLACGYTLVVTKRFLVTEKKKEQVEGESIETNKMLGLSFQGQGMLDLAFEKFRKCPVDESMKELLYNLGLDFERKRQFNKAVAVYEFIATKDKNYKDLAQKIDSLKKAAQGLIMGGPIGQGRDATVVVEGSSIKPTLGRYEIIKELGKGAMGIVYLGKDPKINRMVAIKTMRFDDDVDAATTKAIKERFFREAESAGNLSHPNIVKIYDAGDEQDVSYIAMELLEGEDLKKYTSKDNLLAIPKVMEYVATTAEALNYAHKQGVVHRDIKPANIMLLKDGALRVTDFGIARITASSKTATGTVLGTPSYMSPEQISGKKVDGRADLFSLGVMFFEMLSGQKPWEAESIGTLLYQIANEPHPDPIGIRKEIPPAVAAIINKALQKNPDLRYQNGEDMAKDIRDALAGKTVQVEIAKAPAPTPATGTATGTPQSPLRQGQEPDKPREGAQGRTSQAAAPVASGATPVSPHNTAPILKPPIAPAPVNSPSATNQPLGRSTAPAPVEKTIPAGSVKISEPLAPNEKTLPAATLAVSKPSLDNDKTVLLPPATPTSAKPSSDNDKTVLLPPEEARALKSPDITPKPGNSPAAEVKPASPANDKTLPSLAKNPDESQSHPAISPPKE
ncbi:MAG: protein kinase, partial [Elusimicrobiota bacterium]